MGETEITLAEAAYADLVQIEEYIAQDSPTIARRFVLQVFNKLEQLRSFPNSGKIVPEFGRSQIREIRIKRYRIVYHLTAPDSITVLRVIHGARLLDIDLEE